MLIGFLTIFQFREKNTWLHFDLVCDLLWNRCTAKWNCSVHNKILWHSTFTKPISGTVERHKIESKSCLVVYLSRIKVNRKTLWGTIFVDPNERLLELFWLSSIILQEVFVKAWSLVESRVWWRQFWFAV